MIISDKEGEILVKTARLAVVEYLRTGNKISLSDETKSRFSYNSGVFVTLSKGENLRGCIGFPTPEKKLYQSLVDAAVASATEDPRFRPVRYEELDEITFEVTVLTPPTVIKVNERSEYPNKIKVGRDGLVIKSEVGSGLLLPQVPIEHGWNEVEFLGYACDKAGAPRDFCNHKITMIL